MRNLRPYPFTQVAVIRGSFIIIQLGPGPNLHGKKTSNFALCVDDKKVREESKSERDSEFQSRETDSSEDEAESEKEPELNRPTPSNCIAECCFSTEKAFQPTNKGTQVIFSAKKRNFNHSYTNNFPR